MRINFLAEMWSGSEEGSYLRLIEFVSLNSRLESNKEEEEGSGVFKAHRLFHLPTLSSRVIKKRGGKGSGAPGSVWRDIRRHAHVGAIGLALEPLVW